jgi:hypothetical protein
MDEKEVSLLRFVRKAAAEARKNAFGQQPARQTQRLLEGGTGGLIEAGADVPSRTDDVRGLHDRNNAAASQKTSEPDAEALQLERAPIEGSAEMVPIVLVESAQPASSIAKEDDETSFLKLLRGIVTPARAGMVFQDGLGHSPQAEDDADESSGATEQIEAEDSHGIRWSARIVPDEADFRFDDPKAVVEQPPQIEVVANPDQEQTKDGGSDRVEAGVATEVSTAAAAGPKPSQSAREISELIRDGLRQIGGFPGNGIDVTVYGFGREWNALLTFAPGSTTFARATSYRKALPELVIELRKQVELGLGDEGPTAHRFG